MAARILYNKTLYLLFRVPELLVKRDFSLVSRRLRRRDIPGSCLTIDLAQGCVKCVDW